MQSLGRDTIVLFTIKHINMPFQALRLHHLEMDVSPYLLGGALTSSPHFLLRMYRADNSLWKMVLKKDNALISSISMEVKVGWGLILSPLQGFFSSQPTFLDSMFRLKYVDNWVDQFFLTLKSSGSVKDFFANALFFFPMFNSRRSTFIDRQVKERAHMGGQSSEWIGSA
jgi:hypothetical protein